MNLSIQDIYQRFLECSSISTDTRQPVADSMFFALPGKTHNGSTFIPEALQKGCKYIITNTPPDPSLILPSSQIILVSSPLLTLQHLALYHRRHFSLPIIGITGSNGKTTTKQLISSVLSQKYKVLSTVGSLNNQLGVPLTLLRLTKEHEVAVVEMGVGKKGDMKELLEMVEPEYGVITNVMKAHIGEFKTVENIMREKGELYEFVRKVKGRVFVNKGDKMLVDESEGIDRSLYGIGDESAQVSGTVTSSPSSLFLEFSYTSPNNPLLQIQTHLVGSYNLLNCLAAISIATHFHIPSSSIQAALSSYTPSLNRSQYKITSKNHLVIDCYNANPSSMKLSLDNFEEIQLEPKMWIVGMMGGLGGEEKEENMKVVERFRGREWREGEKVYFIGAVFGEVEDEENVPIKYLKTVEEMMEVVQKEPIEGYKIFLKGSASVGLAKLIPHL